MRTAEEIIPYGSIEILIGLFVIIVNSFIIFIFFKDKKLRKRKSNYLLISLAFSDLFLGLLVIPLTIAVFFGEPKEHICCILVLSLIRGIRAVSIYGIIAISFDRYKALSSPIEYVTINTMSSVKLPIFLTWLFGFLVGSLKFNWNKGNDHGCHFIKKVTREYLIAFQVLTAFCPLILLIIIYIAIYKNMIKVHETHVCPKCVDVNTYKGECKIRRKEKVATLSIIGIVLSFLVCRIPLNVYNILNLYEVYRNFNILNILLLLYYLSAIINPILYAFRLKDFRKSSLKIFKRNLVNDRDFSSCRDL